MFTFNSRATNLIQENFQKNALLLEAYRQQILARPLAETGMARISSPEMTKFVIRGAIFVIL